MQVVARMLFITATTSDDAKSDVAHDDSQAESDLA
jgi:hypothetical protein